jgi:predicted small lipoprotein YifL
MKKLTAIVIILTMLLSLAACGGKDDDNSKETSNVSTVSQTDESSSGTASETSSTASEESSAACSAEESNTASGTDSSEEENSAASSAETSSPALEGSLEDILAAVYKDVEGNEELTLKPEYLVTTAIDPNNCFYYFGVNTLAFKEGIASEPEMGGGYSLCLIRANSQDDVESLKETIAANVDPYKWVCMGVEKDKVVVDSIGDVVILIMYDQSEYLHQAFLDLAGE